MKIKKILAFVFAVSVCMSGLVQNFDGSTISNVVYAERTEDGNFFYTVRDNTVSIVSYHGTETKVIIPEEIDGKKVTRISGGLQTTQNKITEVIMPEGVTTLESEAFKGCTDLSEITIPKSVTNIGDNVFLGTKWLDNKIKENPLVIVNNTVVAGYECKGSVTIPDNVTRIASYAFKNAVDLTEIIIPDSVTSMGISAFEGCTSLTKIEIPNKVQAICMMTFKDCSNLSEIIIPYSLEFIYEQAFEGTKWFAHQKELNPLGIANDKAVYYYDNSSTELIIPDGVTVICNQVFVDNKLSKITVPETVKYIGLRNFVNFEDLVMYGYENSYAQKYATENNIKFVIIGSEDIEQPEITKPVENPNQSTVYSKGDCDGNGHIDVTDLSLISLVLVGDITFTEEQTKAADIDGNGSVQLTDLARLKQYIMKVIPSLN